MPSGARMPPWVLRIRNSGRRRCCGVPAHAGVLGQAEEVAAGRGAEQLLVQGQAAGGAGGVGLDLVEGRVGGVEGGRVEWLVAD